MPLGLPMPGQELVVKTADGRSFTLKRTSDTCRTIDFPGFWHVSVVSDDPELPSGTHTLVEEEVFEKGRRFQIEYSIGQRTRATFTSEKIDSLTIQ